MKRGFIIGNPRSGTTLLRLLLNAHSHIVAPPESGFLQWWHTKYSQWQQSDSQCEDKRASFIRDLLKSKKIEDWNLDARRLDQLIQTRQPENYGALTSLVYETYAMQEAKKPELVLDKNNYYIHYMKELREIWPQASFLFIIRDGRDVACSYLEIKNLKTDSPYKPDLPENIKDIASEWHNNNKQILQIMEELPNQSLLIRYEDLVQKPQENLSKILTFFGLQFQPAMLEFYKHNDEPASTLDWKKSTQTPIDTNSVGKFKHLLTKAQIEAFETIGGDMLRYGNYQ